MPGTASRIYIAHTPSDKRFAARLARDLRARGRDAWFAEWAILAAVSGWEDLLERVPDESWLGIVLSPAALKPRWIWREPGDALLGDLAARAVRRIPILREGDEPPNPFRHLGHADFSEDYEAGLAALLARLAASVPLPERGAAVAASPAAAGDGRERTREYFEHLLRRCGGDISQAARVSGMESHDFHEALRRAGVDPLKFRS